MVTESNTDRDTTNGKFHRTQLADMRLIPYPGGQIRPSCDARGLVADGLEALDNNNALCPRPRQVGSCVPVERNHLLQLQGLEAHVVGAFMPDSARGSVQT